ncbi:phage antirepressor KilAC domain-containing protein [Paenibacillus sp. Lou8.1]|uniref:phage antirepressor KilAC domain-containing protein n=1 Tax=Paenibacillus sp. Lou8.1 TaxID=2962041 RepID=UPI0020B72183|nr:phage antirepressor KilAC domain-containing protein [Paenibacillus sp. Lou8.1]MCP3810077.1 phage antirepressor KilAC domain-containing protein [Paenibacillus sp. Lou8.1]
MNNYKPIVYKNQRVLTTVQLAESFGTDTKIISKNFERNESRYTEGKHFHLLTGDELREFKASRQNDVLPNLNRLYLWTEKGAWMHAKSVNTDEAWEAYEMLVDDYYRIKEVEVSPSYMIDDPIARAQRWIEEARGRLLLEDTIKEFTPKVAYYDTILNSKGTVTTSQIAKDYGLTAQQLNTILKNAGMQYKLNGQWLLYSKHANKGYAQSHSFNVTRSDGRKEVKMITKWMQRGRIMIHELLASMDIKPNIDKEYNDAK